MRLFLSQALWLALLSSRPWWSSLGILLWVLFQVSLSCSLSPSKIRSSLFPGQTVYVSVPVSGSHLPGLTFVDMKWDREAGPWRPQKEEPCARRRMENSPVREMDVCLFPQPACAPGLVLWSGPGLALGLHPLSPPEDMGCRETQGMVPLAWTLERSKLAAQGTAGVQGARLWCGAWLLSPKLSYVSICLCCPFFLLSPVL